MRNFIQEGEALDLIAPSGGVLAGKGYFIGGMFVIAASDADATETFVGYRSGVFELTKAEHETDEALTAGGKVYYDNTAKAATATATGNKQIGVAVEAAASTADTAKVVLIQGLAPAVTALVAPANTSATNSTPYGYSQAQANAIVTWIIAADAALKAHGISLN